MDKYIDEIYNLIYSPIVTPYNLLENVKLDNYFYVNYYKGDQGIIAEMKCTTEDGEEAIFYYNFDKEEKLINIYMEKDSLKTLVFDRKMELDKLKLDFVNNFGECAKSAI